MELCFHGVNTTALRITILMILLFCNVTTRSLRRVSLCKNNKLKSNCDDRQMSLMWTINRNPPSYFFGTIHVPYTRVWDSIPKRVKRAFESSDSVFFELDLMDPYTVSTLANCQMLPHGKKLMDVLPGNLYRRLKRHLDYVRVMLPFWMTADQRGRGLYAEYLYNAIAGNWERKRPVWVMLMVNSLTESDIKSRGIPVLDLYLAQEAQRLNKKTGSVEKVEEQCIPLNGLNFSQVIFALNQTLHQHESIRRGNIRSKLTTDDLIRHYNCGDLNEIIFNHDTTHVPSLLNNSHTQSRQEIELARHIDQYFRSELIVKRNKRMSQRVLHLLDSHPEQSFFFAFGAGHFLGNDSILDFMSDAGFDVVRVSEANVKRRGRTNYNVGCRTHQTHNLRRHESQYDHSQTHSHTHRHAHRHTHPHTHPHTHNVRKIESRHAMPHDYHHHNHHNRGRIFINSRNKHHHEPHFSKLRSSLINTHSMQTSAALSWKMTETSFTSSLSPSSPPSPPSPILFQDYSSSKHYRTFNDLWVRLETVTTKTPLLIPREEISNDVQNYLRLLYEPISNNSHDEKCHSIVNILIFYIHVLILLISF